MVWWEDDPALLDSLVSGLAKEFLDLSVKKQGGKVVVFGDWHVYMDKEYATSYTIKIDLPDDYPISMPVVYETGNRIKKSVDTHFIRSEIRGNYSAIPIYSACLFAPPERWERWPPGSNFNDFLKGPVNDFFLSQAYYELTGKWLFGERPHGIEGIFDYYAEKLNLKTEQVSIILKCLQYALIRDVKSHVKCPCDKSKRLISCHWRLIKGIVDILPREQIIIDIKRMSENYLRKQRILSGEPGML